MKRMRLKLCKFFYDQNGCAGRSKKDENFLMFEHSWEYVRYAHPRAAGGAGKPVYVDRGRNRAARRPLSHPRVCAGPGSGTPAHSRRVSKGRHICMCKHNFFFRPLILIRSQALKAYSIPSIKSIKKWQLPHDIYLGYFGIQIDDTNWGVAWT